MPATEPYRIRTITELHQQIGLSRPEHPLISVIQLETMKRSSDERPRNLVLDFYAIALKRHCQMKFNYGQQQYDFAEGIMSFMAPGQVFGRIDTPEATAAPALTATAAAPHPMTGWALYLHPDFLWNTPLAKTIRRYEYFDYSVHEALYLSEKEESIIIGILQNIQTEYFANMDKFSQDIIISQLEVFLNYSDRFYHRQFLTRKIENHKTLHRLEELLTDYFNDDAALSKGLPTVQYIAEKLNISPNYLSGLLKVLTGRNTQQHIQDKIIEKAKEKISTTDLSVSEISYELGFDHPQSFSRLFKAKTGLSPLEFRHSFN